MNRVIVKEGATPEEEGGEGVINRVSALCVYSSEIHTAGNGVETNSNALFYVFYINNDSNNYMQCEKGHSQ